MKSKHMSLVLETCQTCHGQGDVASKYGVGPSIVVRHQWLSKINFDFLPAKINYDKS